jgi:hypothetical protein
MRVLSVLLAGAVCAWLPTAAAQLAQPPPATLSPPPGSGSRGPQLIQPPAPQSNEIPSAPAQRPLLQQIPSTGPSSQPLVQPAAPPPLGQVNPLGASKVLDATGKPVHGTVRVAPDRVYDPATGRYYWTRPAPEPVPGGAQP